MSKLRFELKRMARSAAFGASAIFAALPSAASAQTAWTNAGTGNWFTAVNWSAGVPNGGTDATIDNGGTAQISSGSANANILAIGDTATGSLTVQSGGALSDSLTNLGSAVGSNGMVVVDGTGSSLTQTVINIATSGDAALTIRNGGFVTAGTGYVASSPSGNGTVLVDGFGSRFTANGVLYVGYHGAANLSVRNRGTVTSHDALVGSFLPGQASALIDGAGSAWNLQGALLIGNEGNGSVTIQNAATIQDIGATAAVKIAESVDSTGTLNIGGGGVPGALVAPVIVGGSGMATMNFNHTGAMSFAVPMSGPLVVNKLGAGATTLTSASTYTGATTVSAGTLIVQGTLGNTPTSVASGATLGGNGSIGGPVTLQNRGTVAPGVGVGTLSAASLDWISGGEIAFDLGANDAGSDHLALTTSLTKRSAGTYRFAFTDGAAPPTIGTYTLVTFTSSSGFVAGDFTYVYSGALTRLGGTFELTSTALLFHVGSLPVELQSFSVE
jgi:T5SS/PEP-CTERM-associated repeat protein/autotransporter-associated beta strand protein